MIAAAALRGHLPDLRQQPHGHKLPLPYPGSLGNSIALVTGANKGIGKEIARLLAAAGLTIYAGSRDAGRERAAVDEIGGDARLLVLDVTDAASVADAARQIGISIAETA